MVFVSKLLHGDTCIAGAVMKISLAHVEIGINNQLSLEVSAHKHLVAHRQITSQPVAITAQMTKHHSLQDSCHLLICLIENNVESA